jgi:hypothetical protein
VLDHDTVVYGPNTRRRDGRPYVRRTPPGARRDSDPRVCVAMHDRGCKLEMFFEDFAAEGPVLEVRLLPEDGSELTPSLLSDVMSRAALYTRYARASIKHEHGEVVEMLTALRDIGTTRRGLSDEFYRRVANHYGALLREGEPHPVKRLAEINSVTISAASRWLSEARRRGHIEPEAGTDG